MKFKKKPVVIEAHQFVDTQSGEAIITWIRDNGGSVLALGDTTNPLLGISTLEGMHEASVGDWIIQGIKGEFYPCKPDIFEATYERMG